MESIKFREALEKDMIYLVTYGMLNEVRDNTSKSIDAIMFGHEDHASGEANSELTVRMVTGDHIETAKSVAIKAGLITEVEANNEGVVMHADDFNKAIGSYTKIWDSDK